MSFIFDACHRYLGTYITTAPNRTPGTDDMRLYQEQLASLNGREFRLPVEGAPGLPAAHFIGKGCKEESPTIILFNGNTFHYQEYMAKKYFRVEKWLEAGFNVLLFNNRGVATKTAVSKEELECDGEAALRYIRDQLHVKESDITLHCHSLGAGAGSEIATRYNVQICCDRTFTKLSTLIEISFGNGCVGKMLAIIARLFDWEYDVKGNWDKIKGKKWIQHFYRDGVIPRAACLATSFPVDALPARVDMEVTERNTGGPHMRAPNDAEIAQYLKFIRA